MNKVEFIEKLKNRTKQFALDVIKLPSSLPYKQKTVIITKQLVRSASSVGANYRATIRARSQAEFFSKMCVVIEETDECLYWLELLQESGILNKSAVQPLYSESEELLKIFATARKNTRK